MKFALAALFACTAFGQSAFQFEHPGSPMSYNEMANAMRAILDIKDATVDASAKTLTVYGSSDQVAAVSWLFSLLDRNIGQHEYRLPRGEDLIRVYPIAHAKAPAAMQEVINIIRTAGEISHVAPYHASNTIVVRATADKLALTDWLVQSLDRKPGVQPDTGSHEYPMAQGDVTRIFYLQHMDSPASLQELINVARTGADVSRIFPYNAAWALMVRGTPGRVGLVAWMVELLDRPSGGPADTAVHEYHLSGSDPDPVQQNVVRVFFPANAQSSAALQSLTNSIRTTVKLNRVFPFNSRHAVVARGTESDIAQVEQLVQQADKAAH